MSNQTVGVVGVERWEAASPKSFHAFVIFVI